MGYSEHHIPQRHDLLWQPRPSAGRNRRSGQSAVGAAVSAVRSTLISPWLCSRKLIQLGRAAYVREATRFKSTLDTVDVPVRDSQVIDEAAGNASHFHLPENVAFAVFSAIINSSVPFEKCVFNSFSG